MRLTRLTMRGLKGAAEEVVDLSPVTLFHGPNASGKTRIADAVRLLALGYHPDEPRTTDGVLRLAAGGSIEVEGRFEGVRGHDRPVIVTRSWRRTVQRRGADAGKVRAETDVRVSVCRTGGRKAHEAAAKELFGEAVLYDLRDLLDLSDPRRRRLLFRLGGGAAAEAWTIGRVRDCLGGQSCLADAQPSDGGWDGHEDILEWVDRRYAQLHEDALETERAVLGEQAAEDGLSEGLEAPDPMVVGDLEGRIVDAERAARADSKAHGETIGLARSALDAGLAMAEGAGRAQDALVLARAELRSLEEGRPDVGSLRDLLSSLEDGPPGDGFGDDGPGVDALRRSAEAARRALEARPDGSGVAAASAALDEAEARSAAATGACQEALRRRDEAAAAARAANDEAGRLQRRLDALRDAVDDRAGGFGGPPTCDACGQEIGAPHVAIHAERVRIARSAHVRLEAAAAAALDEAAAASGAQDVAARALAAGASALRCARKAADDARSAARRMYEAADDAVRSREREIGEARRALEAATKGGPDDARMGALRERIASMEGAAAAPTPDLPRLRSDLVSAERRARDAEEAHGRSMAPLKERMDRLRAALRDLEQAQAHRVRRLEREAEAARLRSALEAMGPRGLMGAAVRDVTAPFCEAVNKALDGLDLGVFAVRLLDERGRPVFHLGLERGRTDMDDPLSPPSDGSTFAQLGGGGLSGGERAAVHAGVVLALSEMTRSWWTVAVVDEIQDLDRERRSEFMARLVALQRTGRYDQVLMMGCHDNVDPVDGVEVVDLSPLAERRAGRAAA